MALQLDRFIISAGGVVEEKVSAKLQQLFPDTQVWQAEESQ